MVYTFHKNASQEDERLKHNKGEIKELLRKELLSYVGVVRQARRGAWAR